MKKPRKCWIAGSGEYGCLYDNACAFSSRDDAVNYLIELFGIARTRKAGILRRDGCVDLGPSYGAGMCEVSEGDVDEWWDSSRGEWRDAL